MPIKPENRARYPNNWTSEIRPAILERAKHCCEICGVPNYSVGWFMPKNEPTYPFMTKQWEADYFSKYSVSLIDLDNNSQPIKKPIKVVLTIMHLNHTPEDSAPSNLKAACQRCHNAYDAPHRRVNAAITRANNRKQTQLFAG
jgi:5-methylcytosine-specific restriction endonuclease McrA